MRKDTVSNRLLFYDSDWGGHHIEFIIHIISYLDTQSLSIVERVVFLLHPGMREFISPNEPSRIQIVFLTPEELEECSSQINPLIRGLNEWKFLKNYISEYRVQLVFFMFLDYYLLLIGILKYSNRNLSIGGIQFLPYYRMSTSTKLQALKRWWHSIKLKWATSNKSLKIVFILNDYISVNEINKCKWHNKVLRYLPDPINSLPFERPFIDSFDIKNYLEDDKFTLLVFGHISPRKNLNNILRSLGLLNPNQLSKVQLLIVGEVMMDYQPIFDSSINSFLNKHTDFNISRIEEYVSIDVMNVIFENVACLLIPYTNTNVSSGIIGIAVKYNKVVIGPNTGVMKDLIEDYGLGYIVSPFEPKELTKAINLGINSSFRKMRGNKCEQYLNERTSKEFGKKILESILGN